MKKCHVSSIGRSIGVIVAVVMVVCLNATSVFGRELLDMNSDWAFYRGDVPDGGSSELDDRNWMAVSLPHIMQLEIGRASCRERVF